MHSGYPLMGPTAAADDLLLVDVEDGNAWGPFHEIGHNLQWKGWVLPGTTESSVNLWSLNMYESLGVEAADAHGAISPAEQAELIADYVAGGADFDEDFEVWTALCMYL